MRTPGPRERQAVGKRAILVCILAAAGAAVGARIADQRDIAAESFTLLDSNKKPLTILAMDEHGPGLTLFDPSGLKRVDIRGDDDGYSRIQIYGKDRHAVFGAGSTGAEHPCSHLCELVGYI